MNSEENLSSVILVVDDDESILQLLELRFSSAGFQVLTAKNGQNALELLKNHQIDMVIADLKMPVMGGRILLREIQKIWPGLPVIFLTAYGSIPDAVEAVREGAVDYISKPFDGQSLLEKVKYHLGPGMPKRTSFPEYSFQEKIWGGCSPATKKLFELIARVAPIEEDVLITGESGTGKELVAQIIHEHSPRFQGPFSVVDCGSTSESLLESELFGHKKGSFTNAIQDKKGLIQEANKGTLFLDEIGNISIEMQYRLLRFLQERSIRRVGETKYIPIDCRVIVATNANLPSLIQEGKFREDLYYRIKGLTIEIPPLRERTEDIPILTEQFLAQYCRNRGHIPSVITSEARQKLMDHSWPGNVRELQQVIKRGVILCQNNTLKPEDLQLEEFDQGNNYQQQYGFSLEESERQTIIRALKKTNWVQKRAAELLGISRRAIHYKIKRLNINIPTSKIDS